MTQNCIKGSIPLDSIYFIIKFIYMCIRKVTDNKRKLIYNENNKLIKTEAFVINDKKEIINK